MIVLQFILQLLSLFLWLLAVPFCMGLLLLPLLPKRLQTPGVTLIAGYILLFTMLELVGIPIVLTVVYHGFTTFMWWFAPVLVVMALAGIVVTYLRCKPIFSENCILNRKNFKLEEKILLIFFVLLVGFQMYMAFTRASFDGDDAYYNVQAVIAQQIDTLYRVNPDTGSSAPLDIRHGLALFPIWEAFIGSMSGLHATIVCHSVIPLLLIPLTYILYFQIGRLLFDKRKELLPMFMLLLALWQMFGNISIYTTETFFLTRTWQGKSFAGNFIIPAVIWIFLALFKPIEETDKDDGSVADGKSVIAKADIKKADGLNKQTGLWLLLACINLAGGASSSLAVLLSVALTAGLAVLFAIWQRKFSVLVKAGLTCVSGGAYVLLYLLLSHGFIL